MKKTQTAPTQQKKQLNATERLARAEGALMNAYQTMDNMARDLLMLRDAVKLLGNKLQSVVQLSAAGTPLTDENIGKQMVENNITELAEKVKDFETKGIFVKSETLGESGFVVGRELDKDDKLVNPRLQFAMVAQPETVRKQLVGAKPGDVISLSDLGKFEVLETYSIQEPKQEAPADQPAAAAPQA